MNTVFKYVIEIDLLNCHAKFCSILEKMTVEVAIFGNFPDLTELIHAICPGGTEKSPKFDPLKSVPAGHHFSCKIYFVPYSLWLVKCTPFSGFWSDEIASRPIIRSSNQQA